MTDLEEDDQIFPFCITCDVPINENNRRITGPRNEDCCEMCWNDLLEQWKKEQGYVTHSYLP